MRPVRLSRGGGGGVEFTYSKAEERRFEQRKLMKRLVPMLAEALADLVDGGEQVAEGIAELVTDEQPVKKSDKKMKAAAPPARQPQPKDRAANLRAVARQLKEVMGSHGDARRG